MRYLKKMTLEEKIVDLLGRLIFAGVICLTASYWPYQTIALLIYGFHQDWKLKP